MKQYAVIDEYGAEAYRITGEYVRATYGYAEVFDQKNATKAIIRLKDGHSIMEVCDIVGGERRATTIEAGA